MLHWVDQLLAPLLSIDSSLSLLVAKGGAGDSSTVNWVRYRTSKFMFTSKIQEQGRSQR